MLGILDLSLWQLLLVITAAFLVGFAKTGIGGVAILVVPFLAMVFGGKGSTGILLPMLMIGDVFAVLYYSRHADWSVVRKLSPWALAGLIVGLIAGGYLDDRQFKFIIAAFVLIGLAILVYMEKKGEDFRVPDKAWFYGSAGILAGFASMIGNAAGPIFSIYLLSRGFGKKDYMGTYSWFFLLINFTKAPLQIFFWRNITPDTLLTACIMIPVITLGAFLGAAVIKRINDKPFRYVIIIATAISAIKLLF